MKTPPKSHNPPRHKLHKTETAGHVTCGFFLKNPIGDKMHKKNFPTLYIIYTAILLFFLLFYGIII
jgi:hypothetical protein